MATASENAANDAIASAYAPLIRVYFAVMAIYYASMSVSHFVYVAPDMLLAYLLPSGLSAIVLGAAAYAIGKARSIRVMEIATVLVSGIVLANIQHALNLEFSAVKLQYFLIVVTVFALASVSFRQALLSSGTALFCLFFAVRNFPADQQVIYGFVGFGAAMSALSISFYLRRALGNAAIAEAAAQKARAKAEQNLENEKSQGDVLREKSLSDSLTKLPNRRAFFSVLEPAIANADDDSQHWVALLDLDGFKAVNDTHGHLMGDELLRGVSDRLRKHCEGIAQASRMGGDEFAIITQNAMSEGEMVDWCEQLLASLAQVYPIEGRLIQISGSMGCCKIEPCSDETGLLQSADYALLHAKKTGKDRVVTFDDEHAKAASEHFRIEHALRNARFEREIELVFQPQFALDSQRMVRAEVLARWHSPSLGLVPPDQFVKVAEECGLIADISVTVLRKAIQALEDWEKPVPLSINLSANDLSSNQTMDEIMGLLVLHQVDPELLEFEVTETAMFQDKGRAEENLQRLSGLGYAIAVDDFGVGYSNFNYLRTLPINKIKIDRSFLDDLQDPMTEKMLNSLVGIAGTLGVQSLLEGVEDELGLLMAKRAGADLVQGYLTGRPMTAADLEKIDPAGASEAMVAAGSALGRKPHQSKAA
jgi:diguanylate cyclase (GGDEF)-like protein